MTPRLREDLVAATVEEDGVVYVDLSDPTTGASFRFYDFEYELAKQLNGQPVAAVVAWASDVYQTDMTVAALDEFVEKLAGLGFLVVPGVVARPKEPLPSSPFAIPSTAAEPEMVELASAPMFGELPGALSDGLSGELFGDLSAGPSAPPIVAPGLTPAITEPRLREGSGGAPASKSRTLTGLNLAPLTPMSAPGGSDAAAAPPVLPRLQSLGSPLPPLMADAVRGGGEVKRAPPRPGSAASAPPPLVVPPPKPQSS